MPLAAPPVAPNSLAFVEAGLGALDESPLADADKLRVIGLISSYTLSEARMAHDAARAARQAGLGGGTSPAWSFDALLRELVDERAYPRLYRIAWSNSPEATRTEHEEFMFGIERILDGIEAFALRGPVKRLKQGVKGKTSEPDGDY
jgi:hypothetical protein